jgi:hypothetical protein
MKGESASWQAAAIAILGLVLAGSGVYWFAPQRVLLDRKVAEAIPSPTVATDPSTVGEPPEEPSGVEELAAGEFRSLEHETTGLARIVELEDGSRFVRLEGLDTSDGSDLRIYLTDQPLSEDWGVWDDGGYVDLGELKGTWEIRTTRSPATWTSPASDGRHLVPPVHGRVRSGSDLGAHTVASRTFARIRMTTSAASATRYHRKTVKSWRFRYVSSPQITTKPLTAEATTPATNSPA